MANDFSRDPDCVTVYRFESGALDQDAKGNNDLVTVGAADEDTVDFMEGACCANFEADNGDRYLINDINLNDFPAQNGSGNINYSFTGFLKRESLAWANVHLKANAWLLTFVGDALWFHVWTANTGESHVDGCGVPTGKWYFFAMTVDSSGTDAVCRFYLYNITDNTLVRNTLKTLLYDGKAVTSSGQFGIGHVGSYGRMDGRLDELTFWKRALSLDDIIGVQDGVYTGPPDKATNPSPADGATEVSTTTDCSWTAGANTDTMDVYWGTSPSSLALVSNDQAGTTYDPGILNDYTTYYWRVDCSNVYGTTTGDLWTFRTAAVPAIVPSGRPVRLPKRLVLPDPRNIRTFTPEECRFYSGVEEGLQRLLQILRDALSPGRNAFFQNTSLTGNTSVAGSLGVVGDVRVDGKVSFYDGNTYITVDGSGNLTFTDAIVGTHTLKQLGCPTYKRIKATAQAEGDLHLSDATNWNISKALILCVRVFTVSTNWSLWLLQNDNGYAADDAVIPKLRIARELSGNANLTLNYPYQDEDASGEVHLYYDDTAGTDTADIHVLGLEML